MRALTLLVASSCALAFAHRPALGSTLRLPRRWERKWSSVSCFYLDLNNRKFSDAEGLSNRESGVKATSDETAYMIASVSKLVTFTALMMLHAEGKFELNDDVSNALGFELRNPRHPMTPVTFRHLLTHTSGLKSMPPKKAINDMYSSTHADCPLKVDLGAWFAEYLNNDGHVELNNRESWFFGYQKPWSDFEPGSQVEYSNLGAALTAVLIERISKESFVEFTKRKIFSKLNMLHTSWDSSAIVGADLAVPYRKIRNKFVGVERYCFVDYPNGGLWTTTSDLAKFVEASISPDALLPLRLTNEMFSCQTSQCEFGLGWGMDSNGVFSHEGGETGWSSLVRAHFSRGYAWGCLANSEAKLYKPAMKILDVGRACVFFRLKEDCSRIAGCSWNARRRKCSLDAH